MHLVFDITNDVVCAELRTLTIHAVGIYIILYEQRYIFSNPILEYQFRLYIRRIINSFISCKLQLNWLLLAEKIHIRISLRSIYHRTFVLHDIFISQFRTIF